MKKEKKHHQFPLDLLYIDWMLLEGRKQKKRMKQNQVRLIYKSCQIQLTAIKSVIDIDTVALVHTKKYYSQQPLTFFFCIL